MTKAQELSANMGKKLYAEETTAKNLNQELGRKIFAEKLDYVGLPEGNYWSVPVWTCRRDFENRCYILTIGCFRLPGPKTLIITKRIFDTDLAFARDPSVLTDSKKAEAWNDLITALAEDFQNL